MQQLQTSQETAKPAAAFATEVLQTAQESGEPQDEVIEAEAPSEPKAGPEKTNTISQRQDALATAMRKTVPKCVHPKRKEKQFQEVINKGCGIVPIPVLQQSAYDNEAYSELLHVSVTRYCDYEHMLALCGGTVVF